MCSSRFCDSGDRAIHAIEEDKGPVKFFRDGVIAVGYAPTAAASASYITFIITG